jgi:hypothetical protein
MSSIDKEQCNLEYFMAELQRFREVMCSTLYTMEQKDRAFEALSLLYVNGYQLPKGDDEKFSKVFMHVSEEWATRAAFELTHPRKNYEHG